MCVLCVAMRCSVHILGYLYCTIRGYFVWKTRSASASRCVWARVGCDVIVISKTLLLRLKSKHFSSSIMMTRYVTVKRARNTQSIRDGTGLVRKRTATTELEAYERPRIQELERILGFKPGDTDAPELQALPEATRERIRGGALGSGSDARLLTNILEALPRLPGQR